MIWRWILKRGDKAGRAGNPGMSISCILFRLSLAFSPPFLIRKIRLARLFGKLARGKGGFEGLSWRGLE